MVKGKKTEHEKFAGGLYSTTVEGYIPGTGRGIQAATSHCLGQNFAKMFGIEFQNDAGQKAMVWQNSWGFTTRSIGIMIMTHADDSGLVLPPRVAPIQVVFVPIFFKDPAVNKNLVDEGKRLISMLAQKGIRAEIDDRNNLTPGNKFAQWELKGVPLRIEIGPRDLESKQFPAARRDTKEKLKIHHDEKFCESVQTVLDTIQSDMYNRAKKVHYDSIVKSTTWEGFMDGMFIYIIITLTILLFCCIIVLLYYCILMFVGIVS